MEADQGQEPLLVRDQVGLKEVARRAEAGFGEMVKAVVDINRGWMALGGELHADEERLLLEAGSAQPDLWGINLYPAQYPADDWVEFDSMINIRPRQGNRSRGVENTATRKAIMAAVRQLVDSSA